jgi:acetylornithine deacetylase
MDEYLNLLKTLISKPSLSREEEEAAGVIRGFLTGKKVEFRHKANNTWAFNRYSDPVKPSVLLNSHIDTVKPVTGWISDPFTPAEDSQRITGLGSNDAGASVVSLLALFLHFYERKDLPFNLIYSATAEEEISGLNGVASILDQIPPVNFALVGEPTGMALAIAEKGLVVLDCTAKGKAGHAAREGGENALYKALDDINRLRGFRFEKESPLLGPVKITVTQISAGTQHNVIPDMCRFVVDVRTNEHYSNAEVFRVLSGLLDSEITARSFRLNSSGIPAAHPFAVRAAELGLPIVGSPTTSDQAVIPYPSVKIGPGDSDRSHTAGEYILKREISEGIKTYIRLFENLEL